MINIIQNIEKAKKVAKILYYRFNSSDGIFGHNTMPEDLKPKTIKWGSNIPGVSKYEYLMFITMVVSIDYQRDANKLWEAGRKTFEDESTKWLFFPEKVVARLFEEVRSAMQKYKLSKKPNKDAKTWYTVAKSLHGYYQNDPENILKEVKYDAFILYNKKFDLRFKKLFPSLSGDKIYPLWIRMLKDNIKIDLINIEKVPLPVDVHVARSTFTTGVLKGDYRGNINEIFTRIDQVWREALNDLKDNRLTYPLQLDEPLWHLSRYGCTYRNEFRCPVKSKCPVGSFCIPGTIKINMGNIYLKT